MNDSTDRYRMRRLSHDILCRDSWLATSEFRSHAVTHLSDKETYLGGASMIVVHHLDHSRSHRILWLLEELVVEYEVVSYRRDKKTMLAPPELTKIHPLGKSPVMIDGTNTIAESGAIIEYLVEKYGGGRLAPAPGTPSRLRYTYWLHYAEGSAMPLVVMKLVLQRMPAGAPFFIKPIAGMISRGVQKAFVDPQLARHARIGMQSSRRRRGSLAASSRQPTSR
jgi:glutathione S-transferase